MNLTRNFGAATLLLGLLIAPVACDSTANMSQEDQIKLMKSDTESTMTRFKSKFKGADKQLSSAYGYAVYPEIGKGGLIVGAFNGSGLVYEQNKLVATSNVGGGTIGAQIGGQAYSQVTLFQDKAAFDRFKRGEVAFAASGSAVAAGAGASAAVDYKNGVAVYAFGAEGLMLEGVIGGQTFSFEAIK